MSYQLFLDDERIPRQVKWVELPLGPWIIVRSYKEFVEYIERHGMPNFISFDHDLSWEHYPAFEKDGGIKSPKVIPYDIYTEKTGYDCAKWLIDYCEDNELPLPKWAVHSMNPIGKQNITSLFDNYQRFKSTQI